MAVRHSRQGGLCYHFFNYSHVHATKHYLIETEDTEEGSEGNEDLGDYQGKSVPEAPEAPEALEAQEAPEAPVPPTVGVPSKTTVPSVPPKTTVPTTTVPSTTLSKAETEALAEDWAKSLTEACPKSNEEMMKTTKEMYHNTEGLPPYLSVTKGSDKFGYLLFKHLENSINLVFSPFSLSTALAMLLPGAGGETLKQVISLYIQEETLPEILAPFQSTNFYPDASVLVVTSKWQCISEYKLVGMGKRTSGENEP